MVRGLRFWILTLLVISLPFSQVQAYQIDAEFTNQNGEITAMSDYNGKFLLIDAMATWCGPCRVEMAHLQDVYEVISEHDGPEEIELISISLDPESDSIEKVKNFMEEFDAKWSYGLDHDEQLLNTLEVVGFPTTFLINPEGEILKKWLGITPSGDILDEMDKYMDLPGGFIRENNLDELGANLISSPLFYIFLIMIWVLIIYSVFGWIERMSEKQV